MDRKTGPAVPQDQGAGMQWKVGYIDDDLSRRRRLWDDGIGGGQMWKRYLVLYWFGLFYSVVIGGSIIFIYSQYEQRESQKRHSLIYDADYGADLFERYRTEMEILEDYYERIEDWDFSYVSYAVAGKDTYKCYSSYIEKGYITVKEHVPKGFLDDFLDEDKFLREGCRVILQGDQWTIPRFTLDGYIVGDLPDTQILVVEIARDMEQSVSYLYMPDRVLTIEGYAGQNVVLEPLEDGWYYICIEYGGEIWY